jgi:hypothetical protein
MVCPTKKPFNIILKLHVFIKLQIIFYDQVVIQHKLFIYNLTSRLYFLQSRQNMMSVSYKTININLLAIEVD